MIVFAAVAVDAIAIAPAFERAARRPEVDIARPRNWSSANSCCPSAYGVQGAAGSNTAVLIGFAETPQARACGVHVRVFHTTLDPVLLVPNDGAAERQRSTRTTWYSTAGPRGTLNRALTA